MPLNVEIVLVVLVTAAAWSDLNTRRISNWITVPGAALGLALQAWNGGIHGALTSLAGAGLGLLIFIGFYVVGGMGAGDVKLFSAVGAFVGPWSLILVFVFTGLLGGIAAVALAASHGRLRETLERTGDLLLNAGWFNGRDGLRPPTIRRSETAATEAPDALRLPYGAVIAGGTLVSLVVLH